MRKGGTAFSVTTNLVHGDCFKRFGAWSENACDKHQILLGCDALQPARNLFLFLRWLLPPKCRCVSTSLHEVTYQLTQSSLTAAKSQILPIQGTFWRNRPQEVLRACYHREWICSNNASLHTVMQPVNFLWGGGWGALGK